MESINLRDQFDLVSGIKKIDKEDLRNFQPGEICAFISNSVYFSSLWRKVLTGTETFQEMRRQLKIEFQLCCRKFFEMVIQLESNDDPSNAWYLLAAIHFIHLCSNNMEHLEILLQLLLLFPDLTENIIFLLEDSNESYLRFFVTFYDELDPLLLGLRQAISNFLFRF